MGIGIAVTMVLSFVGEAALADGFSSRNCKSLFSSQTKILDNRRLKQYSDSVRLKPANITTPSKWSDQIYRVSAENIRLSFSCSTGSCATSWYSRRLVSAFDPVIN